MPEDKLSFVPQKKFEPLAYRQGGPGFLFIASLVVFLLSLVAYGGLLLYKNKVSNEINDLTSSLEKAREALELPVINQLKDVSDKIESTKVLVEKHVSPTAVFDLLEKDTLKKITLKSLDYRAAGKGGVEISVNGSAPDYKTLAQQGDVFEREKGIIRVSFSGLNLGEKGMIEFTSKIILDPSFIIYKVAE